MTVTTPDLKDRVLAILRGHVGHEQAIKGLELACMFGYKDDRLIRLVIRELIAEGHPILSSTEAPYGYFMAETKKEAEEHLGKLYHRAMEDLGRYHDLKMGAGFYFDGTRQGGLL